MSTLQLLIARHMSNHSFNEVMEAIFPCLIQQFSFGLIFFLLHFLLFQNPQLSYSDKELFNQLHFENLYLTTTVFYITIPDKRMKKFSFFKKIRELLMSVFIFGSFFPIIVLDIVISVQKKKKN